MSKHLRRINERVPGHRAPARNKGNAWLELLPEGWQEGVRAALDGGGFVGQMADPTDRPVLCVAFFAPEHLQAVDALLAKLVGGDLEPVRNADGSIKGKWDE